MRTKDGARGLDRNASFGNRLSGSVAASKHWKSRAQDIVRQNDDGGMEITWTASATSAASEVGRDSLRQKKGKELRRKGVESFGAGMERGGMDEIEVSEAEKKGRMQRRKGIRSGSKNVFRNLSS
jgi:ribosome biogenesis protein ENP2